MKSYNEIRITSNTVQTIRDTTGLLHDNAVEIVEMMYEHLFTNYPQFKIMFDMTRQKDGDKKQILALTRVLINFAKDFPNLDNVMRGLKRANGIHVSLSVEPTDYEFIAESLLFAIQTQFELKSSDPILKAWGAAYWLLANAMIEVESNLRAEQGVELAK